MARQSVPVHHTYMTSTTETLRNGNQTITARYFDAASGKERMTNLHPFELAGLGLAPFRLCGFGQDMRYGEALLNRAEYERTGIALTTKPGGTCAYCGRAIKVLCHIESSDGKKFHVGSDCAQKVAQASDLSLGVAIKQALITRERANRRARAALAAEKREIERRKRAEVAEIVFANILRRLDIAASWNPAFGRMATDIRNGRSVGLSHKQAEWLESVERSHGEQ